MKNLLIITQKVDEDDDLLGFFVGWIREFAKNFEKVFVIALGKGKCELPENVEIYSLGKERGVSKIIRLFNFYKFLFRLIPRSDGIFVHMSPIFVVSSAPIARFYNKKIIFWYLHRSVTFRLRLAAILSHKLVTASVESLGIKIPSKIIAVGHGIDTSLFKANYQLPTANEGLRILSVGRISPIKNYETLIRAAEILKNQGQDFSVKIIGRPLMKGDGDYLRDLASLVARKKLDKNINFVGFVPFGKMPTYYHEADIVVNLTPKGGIDKTVLEAMASAKFVLVSNEAFRPVFGPYADDLIFREKDPEDLAAKINKITAMPLQDRTKLGEYLRSNIETNHELHKTVHLISQFFK